MKKIIVFAFAFFALGLFGRGFWKGYSSQVYGTDIFLIKMRQMKEGEPLEIWLFGKIATRVGWEQAAKGVADGMLSDCDPACEIVELKKLEKLPEEFAGIYENKPVSSVYISTDTPDLEIVDTRMFLVSDAFELEYDGCLVIAKHRQAQLNKYSAQVTCVNKI